MAEARRCPVNGCQFLLPGAPLCWLLHISRDICWITRSPRMRLSRGPRSLRPEPAKTGYTSNHGGRIMSRPPTSRVQIRRYNSSSVVIHSSVRESSAKTEAWPCPWRHYETLAVRVENPTVVRDRLHNMSQDREESVRAFGARLRGQAAICQYTKACTCLLVVNYTEENVADALITGLADPEIKQGLLGEPD